MYRKWTPLFFKEGFTILPVITKPKSRGTVTLRKVPKNMHSNVKIRCCMTFYE
jgi:hypothetical protein